MSFFGKKPMSQEEWENTLQGKRFMDKIHDISEKNIEKEKEWEKKADPARVVIYKNLKKIFPCFYIPFTLALFIGAWSESLLYIVLSELLLSLLALVLYYFPPRRAKNRSSFLFIPLAFVSAVICWISVLGMEFVERKVFKIERPDAVSAPAVSGKKDDGKANEVFDYEDFLKNNVIEDDDELYDKSSLPPEDSDD